MKRIIKLIFFFAFVYNAQVAFAIPVNDSTLNFSERRFDAAQLKQWRSDRSFMYERKVAGSVSVWDIISNWISRLFTRILSTTSGRWSFWTIVFLISAAIILFFIVRYKTKTSGMFARKNHHIGFEEINENIHSINFPAETDNALKENNYRLAIRLQYLYLLKFLSDKQLINWRAGKTNDEYVKEISMQGNASLYNYFKEISRLFDYMWYGETKAGKEDYDECMELAQQARSESKYLTNKTEPAIA